MATHDDTPFIRLGRKLHQLQEAGEPFRMGLGFDPDDQRVMLSLEWGREAEDSPMIGAASYGVGGTLEEAFEDFIDEIKAPDANPEPAVEREGNNDVSMVCARATLESILDHVAPPAEQRLRTILASSAKANLTLRVGSGPQDVSEADFVAIETALTESTGD